MTIPMNTSLGERVSSARSLNVPGSPSSALQMTYLSSPGAARHRRHFSPVRNPAPPYPRSPDSVIVPIVSLGRGLEAVFEQCLVIRLAAEEHRPPRVDVGLHQMRRRTRCHPQAAQPDSRCPRRLSRPSAGR